MDIKSFIENFAEQFDDTDVSLFTEETSFKNLEEWSSMQVLSLIAMVDESYDVALKSDDINKSETIKDLFELVKSRK